MPIYEYECDKCGFELEITLPMIERDRLTKTPCPDCGTLSLFRKASACSFKVKGACAANGYSTNVADIEKRLGRPINNNDLPE